MRSRFVMATVVGVALACLATTILAQDQGQKGQRGQRGQGGQPGGRGGAGGFGNFGGGFGGFGGFRTSRLQLLNVEAVQKELELVDEQLTAIGKVRDELQPMRGRGGPGGAGGEGGTRRRGGNNPPPPNGASLSSPATYYFVQAPQPPAQAQGGQGRRGGGQGGAGGGFGGFGQPLTPEQQAEQDKQRAERNKQEKDKLAEILLPHQMKRLTEIYYQQLGTNIFTDPDAVAELKITDDQKKKATEVTTANREAITALMQELRGGAGNNAGNAGGRGNFTPFTEEQTAKLTEARKKNDEKVMAILTADQTKKLEELKGKAFAMPENAFGGRGGRGGAGGAPGGNRGKAGGNNNP